MIGSTKRNDFNGAQIRSPATGCSLTNFHSSALKLERLQQNRIWHGNFSDIVNHSGTPQGHKLIAEKAQMLTKTSRVV